jgi:signal transduction histidine kinase
MTTTSNDFERDLLSIVAHDLKTPIGAVKGFIELIQQMGPLNDAQERFAERALGGLDRMEHLVTNLLDLSRIESGIEMRMLPCDLNKLIQESAELLQGMAALRDITIYIDVHPGMGHVIGDSRLLGMVINNLLSNAVKYNREHGEIWISLSDDSRFVRVDVKDTGIGIAEKDLPHLFKRFFRASNSKDKKIEGSGLGLAIVEMIVQRHEGRIWVESKAGEGSKFSFTLPHAYRQAPAVMRDRDWSSEESDGVDDNLQDSEEILDSKEENG